MLTQSVTGEGQASMAGVMGVVFPDPPGAPFVNYDAFDVETVQQQVRAHGFAIVEGLVPTERLERIREFWLGRFSQVEKAERVTWSPYFGQANTIGYTNDKFQCLYRSCDFLWNPPYHLDTREICLRLNGLRNIALGLEPLRGIRLSSDRYGIFVTTSYYPPNEGWLEVHADGVASDVPLLHHIVPLTIKGRDYKDGGLCVIDRTGKEIDVDARMTLGSVLFYDGGLQHGVRRIIPRADRPLGRLQMFGIPTKFVNVELNVQALGRVATGTFVRAKWLRAKNRLFLLAGLDQLIR